MKRLLMRGGMSPLDNFSAETVLKRDSIGSNSGNLLYAYGVYRTLLTEDTTIDMDYYAAEQNRYTEEDIERINQMYDAYICPLADAFRETFADKLVRLSEFFDKLTIPCYVIGVGISAPYEPEVKNSRKFDDAARRFMKAALKKSPIVGLRGEITGAYLKNLGFREERDFIPIGCPSMYCSGGNLTQRLISLDENSKIVLNITGIAQKNIKIFLLRTKNEYRNHFMICQKQNELKEIYYGAGLSLSKSASTDIFYSMILEKKCRIFINVPSWFDFLQHTDFCVGSRLHGSIAAIQSGCPCLFIPVDSRTRELAEYHQLPQISQSIINDNDHIVNLIERVDMQSHIKSHRVNFNCFLSFLDRNHIEHIYQKNPNRRQAPLDAAIRDIQWNTVIPPEQCGREELLCRLKNLYEDWNDKVNALKQSEDKRRKQESMLESLKS